MSIKFPRMKRFISLFLAVVIISALPAVNVHATENSRAVTDYSDACSHWASEALEWAAKNGVEAGRGDKIAPDEILTRAHMAAMLDRLFGTYQKADISRYTDVSPGDWHYDYIAQAVNMGIFSGYSGTCMGPGNSITREQAMAVLARTCCLPAASRDILARFPDGNQVGA